MEVSRVSQLLSGGPISLLLLDQYASVFIIPLHTYYYALMSEIPSVTVTRRFQGAKLNENCIAGRDVIFLSLI